MCPVSAAADDYKIILIDVADLFSFQFFHKIKTICFKEQLIGSVSKGHYPKCTEFF